MLYSRDALESRAALYCAKHQIELVDRLGFGAQGIVYSTTHDTALKIHGHESAFQRERDVYQKLQELGISEIRGLAVPSLVVFDAEL